MAHIVIEAELPEGTTRGAIEAIAGAMLSALPDGTRFTYGTDQRAANIARDTLEAAKLRALRAAIRGVLD